MKYTIFYLSLFVLLSGCRSSQWKDIEMRIEQLTKDKFAKKIVVILNPNTGCMGCIQRIVHKSLIKVSKKQDLIVITNIDLNNMYEDFLYNVYIDEEEIIFDLNKKYSNKNCVLFFKDGKIVSDFELTLNNYDTLPKLKL